MSEKLDIVNLVEKNPFITLSKTYLNRFINKIKENFTKEEQQLFVASFFCHLNHDSKKDFIIDLENEID